MTRGAASSMELPVLHLARPVYLLLLLLLPLVAWWFFRQRRRGVPHPSIALFARLPAGRSLLALHGGLGLRLLALILIALALAQPRWPDLRTRLDTEGIALVMVVDVSGSMGEFDFDWDGLPVSRLDAVKRIFRLFVAGGATAEALPDGRRARFEGRPADQIGLVVFGTRPEAICPLTLEHATLLNLLEARQPLGVPGESETNLSDALALGLARLRPAGARRKVLVLLTDGEHNQAQTRSGWSPRQAAQVAGSLGIPIYTIDAGPAPEAEEQTTPQGRARLQATETLQDLARITRGRAFAARDGAALANALREIDRQERTLIASFQYRRYHEAYPWLGLAAFVLFSLALVLDLTLWRRLP